jgi:hypothetical protein
MAGDYGWGQWKLQQQQLWQLWEAAAGAAAAGCWRLAMTIEREIEKRRLIILHSILHKK